MRQISQEGIELIKRFEGLELESYADVAGIWTIGYGHTGPEVGPGQRISEAEAEELLVRDLERFERGVSEAVTRDISQQQFDALVSLSYNIGVNAFRGSTAVKRINKGDFEGAAEAITWWNKATVNGRKRPILGLTRRRAAEAALFLQGIESGGGDRAGEGAVVETPPRRSNPLNSRTVGGAATAGAAGAAGAGAAMMNKNEEQEEVEVGGVELDADDVTVVVAEDDAQTPAEDEGGPAAEDGDLTTAPCIDPEAMDELEDGLGDEDGMDSDEVEAAMAGVMADQAEPCEVPDLVDVETAGEDDTDPEAEPEPEPETGTVIEVDGTPPRDTPSETDLADAVGIGAGALAVLSAIYVIAARMDDWFNYRR